MRFFESLTDVLAAVTTEEAARRLLDRRIVPSMDERGRLLRAIGAKSAERIQQHEAEIAAAYACGQAESALMTLLKIVRSAAADAVDEVFPQEVN